MPVLATSPLLSYAMLFQQDVYHSLRVAAYHDAEQGRQGGIGVHSHEEPYYDLR